MNWWPRQKRKVMEWFEPSVELSLIPQTAPKSAHETALRPSDFNVGGPREVARRHAEYLLGRLVARYPGEDLLYDFVDAEYRAMCAELGIRPRPWNTVGRYLNDFIRHYGGGRRKPCIPWLDENGDPHYPRIYTMPAATPSIVWVKPR